MGVAGLRCPRCGRPALAITAALDLPADGRSDEISVQLLRCGGCDLRAVGVYEESRRGWEESVDHRGWVVDQEVWASLAAEIGRCPAPRDHRCGCPLHRAWGAQDELGRWRGLAAVRAGDWFPIEYGWSTGD